MNKMAKQRIFIFAVVTLAACSITTFDPEKNRINYERELGDQLSKVDVRCGINEEEAIIISDNYYYKFRYSACGGVGKIEKAETTWNRVVHIGYAAKIIPERITIDKKTGETSWKWDMT